eukprot:2771938-Prymnesium_polylepis.1
MVTAPTAEGTQGWQRFESRLGRTSHWRGKAAQPGIRWCAMSRRSTHEQRIDVGSPQHERRMPEARRSMP